MEKRITSTIVVILSLSAFAASLYAGTYSGGTGEPDSPYQISTVADWQELMATSADWNKSFILTVDIDLAGVSLAPVGNHDTQFTGVFDGDSHVICNAVINRPAAYDIGIFGYVGSGGQILNLGVEDVNITGRYTVGGLVGNSNGSLITSCYALGNVSGASNVGGLVGLNFTESASITSCYSVGNVNGSDRVGGLVGRNEYGSVSYCYSSGSLSGYNDVGGLTGINSGSINSCYSTATVSGVYNCVGGLVGANRGSITSCYSTEVVFGRNYVGGLVGWNHYEGSITSCYSTGNVSGNRIGYYVGGLVGWNWGGSITFCYSSGSVSGTSYVGGLVGRTSFLESIVTFCYAAGSVSGGDYVGGLIGFNESGPVNSCFWDIQTSGQTTSAGGIGKTTEEMQTLSTFLDAGWDFVCETANGTDDIWFMPPDDYPHLTWEHQPEFDLSVLPTTLWPANNKMAKITPAWTATDLCGQSLEVALLDITANEPCNTDDIQISDDGSIYLCATRSGNNAAGRIYTLTYEACDSFDNCTTRSCTVVVPHDMRK